MKVFLKVPLLLITIVFGKLHWQAPTWMRRLWRLVVSNRRFGVYLAALGLIIGSIYFYIESLPGDVFIRADVDTSRFSYSSSSEKPPSIDVLFSYDYSELKKNQQRPLGFPQPARIDLIGNEINSGISISPAISGRWEWRDDRSLRFSPNGRWMPGTEYKISLSEEVFTPNTHLKNDTINFKTTAFSLTLENLEFYQNPTDSSDRKVTSTLVLSHPVSKESLQEHVKLSMRPSGADIDTTPVPIDFTIEYDDNLLRAYILSESLRLPDVSNYMTLTVSPGVKSLLAGSPSTDFITDKVLIPNAANYLKVVNLNAQIIRDDDNQPDQMVFFEFTDAIDRDEIISKTEIYVLPNYYKSGYTYWNYPGNVTEDVLLNSEKLNPTWLENPRNSSTTYNLILDFPEKSQLFVRFNKGLTSINDYYTRVEFDQIVNVPKYPKELNFVGDGSVLSISGDHKLSVSTRGLKALRFTVGQVLEGQLNHIISQSRGDISSPTFKQWRFDKHNFSRMHEKIVRLSNTEPKESNYASLDLSQYRREGDQTYGLFFVSAHGYNESNNSNIYNVEDHRLILITDLGILVKTSANGERDIFVQSIRTSKPVSGAQVELLGKNGLPVQIGKTDGRGHLKLSSARGFGNEKQPVVYVVRHNNDTSFIPYDRSSRQINLSRFDIGGVRSLNHSDQQLSAFIFSDRGIYRPGETANLGFVVKREDLGNVEEAPLEIIINGPRYNRVLRQKITLPSNGFFEYQFIIEPTIETGEYTVSLNLLNKRYSRGSRIGTAKVKIEEFLPDTMKISSQLLGVKKQAWLTDKSITAKINLNNLFGVPAQNRQTQARLIVKPSKLIIDQYPDYVFSTEQSGSEELGIDEKLTPIKTNLDGVAQYALDLQRFNSGTYLLEFIAEGFDQAGGRSVSARNQIMISPDSYVVGYKALSNLNYINKGADQKINLIAVNNKRQKIDKTDLILKTVERRNVSVLVKLRNGTYQYQTVSKTYPLSERAISIMQSGTEVDLDASIPGDYVLEVYDQNDRKLSSINYTIVGNANLDGKITKSAELQVTLSRSDYKPGDTIEMNIKAPYKGAGLITIETDQVQAFKWFKSDTQSSIQSIQVPDTIEGNAYVNVTFTRDVSSSEIFTSPLSYAVLPFSIDKSKREIEVSLDVDDIVRPGKPMEIRYSTDKKSKLVVFAVDEGILQVANHKLPKPLEYFLKKRALGVTTMQIMDLILPEFELFQSLSAAGGGAARYRTVAKNLNPFSRKTDTPAVFWSGIVEADSDTRQLVFHVPNTFSGALRVMAVAVSDTGMGAGTESTVVRGPFVLTPNLLLQAAPGDEFKATVGVANIIEGSGKHAPVKVSVTTSEHLSVVGQTSEKILIDEGGENSATFTFKVNDKLGAADVVFLAQHGDTDSTRTVSLSVRPATPYTSDFVSGYQKKGAVELDLSRQLFAPLAKQSLSASTSPLVIVDGLSEYLQNFPHGCTEQVVSKVFPIMGMTNHPHWSTDNQKVVDGINHAVLKLRQRQQGEGGFSFWPGGSSVSVYPSIYATHFLLEAKESGFSVPKNMLDSVKNYLISYVGMQSNNLEEARIRANGIYLLTRMDEVTTNCLVELQETLESDHKNTWQTDLTASYMAATYLLLKKDKEAQKLINGYRFSQRKSAQFGDFDSALTQDAQHLWLLARHFPEQVKALDGNLLIEFMEPIFTGKYNTIAASYSILALGEYSRVVSELSDDASIQLYATKNNQKHPLPVSTTPFATAHYEVDVSSVHALAQRALYYLNVQTGYDKSLPVEAVSDNIEVVRAFYDRDGKKVTEIKQGDELTVSIRVRTLNGKNYRNIAVVDLLPGGFEVIRSSVARTAYNWRADYVDVREDRVIYYGSFNPTSRELTYKVKVTASGTFVVPPTYVESMYDRSVKAVSVARSVTVASVEQ